MKIEYAGICFQGLVRKNNEDNFHINGFYLDKEHGDSKLITGECENGLFGVFDGIGGEAEGETASFIAAKNLPSGLLEANRMICTYTKEHHLSFCGTTAAVLSVEHGQIKVVNIGDSRIYHIKADKIKQISEDHVRIWMGRRYLTQSLGNASFIVEPFETYVKASAGDYFLLCSDGLTDMLNEKEILGLFGKEPTQTVLSLQEAVMDKGAKDNTTIIIIKTEKSA